MAFRCRIVVSATLRGMPMDGCGSPYFTLCRCCIPRHPNPVGLCRESMGILSTLDSAVRDHVFDQSDLHVVSDLCGWSRGRTGRSTECRPRCRGPGIGELIV